MPRFILNDLSTLEAGLGQLIERIQHYQRALSALQNALTQANEALEHAKTERDRLHLECEALRSERHLLATRIENAKHAMQSTLDDLSHTGWVEPALHLLTARDEDEESMTTLLTLTDSDEELEEPIEEDEVIDLHDETPTSEQDFDIEDTIDTIEKTLDTNEPDSQKDRS